MKKFLFGLVIFTFLFGCASMKTTTSQFEGINDMLSRGDYPAAITQIEAAKDTGYSKKDKVLYYLDIGMLNFYNGNYEKSNEYLEKAEFAIEDNYTKSVGKGATSLFLNDNALDYAGEDYENIYINVFKALNYLDLGSFDGAFVEIRRIDEKLKLMGVKYKNLAEEMNENKDGKIKIKPETNKFHNDVLGRYLSMLLYRAEGNYDDARIDLNEMKTAWTKQSQIYNFSMPDLSGHLDNRKNAKINFLSFVGRSPYKKAKTFYIHTLKNTVVIANSSQSGEGKSTMDNMDSFSWYGVTPDLHFKFQLPYMQVNESRIAKVRIKIDGVNKGDLKLIESISNVAKTTYKLKEPITYIKTITRTVVKGLASHKAKGEMDKNISNPLLAMAAKLATDIAVDSTENADLRIGRFFPAKAYLGEIEIEPGVYDISIEFIGKNGTILFVENFPQSDIQVGGLNLVKSFYLQ